MNLLLRADASAQIGSGHLMRCLALAQAWQEAGGQATFLMTAEAPTLAARLVVENCQVQLLSAPAGSDADAQQTIRQAQQIHSDWVVVDGYQFGSEYQQAIKQAGLRLIWIDDYGHAEPYTADIVLNQNLSVGEALYTRREPYTQVLLGPHYALLRREFWPWRGWQREISPVARKVLVTMGGGDPENVTLEVVEALPQIEGLEATIIVGANHLHLETLKLASKASKATIELRSNVTNMSEQMVWADIAISAGGSTCWELALLGLPDLTVVLADNQRRVAEGLQQVGIALNLGWHYNLKPADIAAVLAQLMPDAGKRQAMAVAGQALIDGNGVWRVLMHMRGERFWLRQVQAQDSRLIWEWANDPETRTASFSSDPITWENHVRWFEAKRQDLHCLYYLAVDRHNEPIGQIRFDCQKRTAVISLGLAKRFRGQGYGSALIQQASWQVLKRAEIDTVLAYVKPNNPTSRQAFLKAGYKAAGEQRVNGCLALLFSLSKEDAK